MNCFSLTKKSGTPLAAKISIKKLVVGKTKLIDTIAANVL